MHVVLMGPPGAGKGTQAEALAEGGHSVHLATGDMLRQALREETQLGVEAKRYLDSGTLVPDHVVLGLVEQRLAGLPADVGFVLDGFPRTVAQAEGLDRLLAHAQRPLDAVLVLEVADAVVVARLGGRRVCTACGAVYASSGRPQRPEDERCDRCGGVLEVRSDDQPETVLRRLQVFRRETEPVIGFYEARGLVRRVPAEGSVGEVRARLIATIPVGVRHGAGAEK